LCADHTFTITVRPAPGLITDKETIVDEVLPNLDPVLIKPKKDYLTTIKETINAGPLGITDEGFTLDTVSIADTASISKPLKFNGGLRLMDAVANEVSGNEDSDLSVGVKLNDDNQKNVEMYSGKLSDGKALPEWIQVNPETGETTAIIPEGVQEVEVQLVALDKDGNTRDINIVLDKAKIKNDQDFTRGTVSETQVVVDNDANVNLIRKTDGRTNQVASNNLNAETDFLGTMKLSDIQVDSGKYTFDVIDDNQSNVKLYKAEMKDGSSLPAWITIDPETGAISADPSVGRTGSAAPAFLTQGLEDCLLKMLVPQILFALLMGLLKWLLFLDQSLSMQAKSFHLSSQLYTILHSIDYHRLHQTYTYLNPLEYHLVSWFQGNQFQHLNYLTQLDLFFHQFYE
jgi:hypothetical protein